MSTATQAGGEPRPDFLARFLSVVPLLVLYFALAALYAWQASRRPVPTIFTDELELTQLARAIAHTGEPARRGVPYGGFASLVAYVLAPVWWLGSSTASWAAAKLILVLAMTATIFPAYGLARMVVPKWYALGAAGAAVAVPALAYAPILVEEPLAYPLATLALWLIARSLERPSWGRAAAAFAASAAAALTRTQLAVLFAVLALGLLWLAWDSEAGRRWRSSWRTWDWVGFAILLVGVAVGLLRADGTPLDELAQDDRLLQGPDLRSRHLGARSPRDRDRDPARARSALRRSRVRRTSRARRRPRAFVVTSVAALAAFVWYAGIKGAYLSNVFATVVVERNVIYLAPILFASAAMAFARGVGRGWAIAAAGVFTVFVVASTPLHLSSTRTTRRTGSRSPPSRTASWAGRRGRSRACSSPRASSRSSSSSP